MNNLGAFRVYGTAVGSDLQIKLDEIVIAADPETIRSLGVFLLNVAYEMEENEVDHIHLQDVVKNFSCDEHVDIIPSIPSIPSIS
jgi:hypothetical protein